jgi:hypothetical protein
MAVFQAGPFYTDSPIRLRGIPNSLAAHHLEGSERCLIHIDNELRAKKGVWMNPNVRVAYNMEAYKAVHPDKGYGQVERRGCREFGATDWHDGLAFHRDIWSDIR